MTQKTNQCPACETALVAKVGGGEVGGKYRICSACGHIFIRDGVACRDLTRKEKMEMREYKHADRGKMLQQLTVAGMWG